MILYLLLKDFNSMILTLLLENIFSWLINYRELHNYENYETSYEITPFYLTGSEHFNLVQYQFTHFVISIKKLLYT